MKPSLATFGALSAANVALGALTMFWVYRELLQMLGSQSVGLWTVLLASTSAVRVTDLGLGASATRFVAKYSAVGDVSSVRAVVQTTATSIAVLVGVLAIASIPLLRPLFPHFIQQPEMVQMAVDLLPWALSSMWLSVVGNVYLSALDGINRIDLRNYAVMLGYCVLILGTTTMVGRYGLYGMAILQVIQSIVIGLASGFFLWSQKVRLPLIGLGWSTERFREIFGYGAKFQLASIAMFLTEPVTKLLVSKYGGLSDVAFFEMANQLLQKLRLVIVSANQAAVPTLMRVADRDPASVSRYYRLNIRLLFATAIPYFLLVALLMSSISRLWLGAEKTQFIHFGWLLAATWCINLLTAPAYFVNVATGHLWPNVIGHAAIGFLCVVLALLFGPTAGGSGVVAGYAFSVAIGSIAVAILYHKREAMDWMIIPKIEISGLVMVLLVATFAYEIISHMFNAQFSATEKDLRTTMVGAIVAATGYCAVIGSWLWLHPIRSAIRKFVR